MQEALELWAEGQGDRGRDTLPCEHVARGGIPLCRGLLVMLKDGEGVEVFMGILHKSWSCSHSCVWPGGMQRELCRSFPGWLSGPVCPASPVSAKGSEDGGSKAGLRVGAVTSPGAPWAKCHLDLPEVSSWASRRVGQEEGEQPPAQVTAVLDRCCGVQGSAESPLVLPPPGMSQIESRSCWAPRRVR